MGIKDKVLDILFDDDNDVQEDANLQEHNNSISESTKSNPIHNTGSIFIDATSPLPVSSPNPKKDIEENESIEPKESTYQMSENISPIFGPISNKNKKNKNLSKIKSINDISNKKFESTPKSQSYSKVVISPIYGPLSSRAVKKVKARKKDTDPFYRDINDTGSFDTVLSENEEDVLDQQIEQANAEVDTISQTETLGDTDRLDRISDRINRIKNEAASLYHEDGSNEELIEQDGYNVETIEYSSISEVIHDVQNHDEKIEHPTIRRAQQEPVEEFKPAIDSITEDVGKPFEEVEETEQNVEKPNVQIIEEPIEKPVEEPIEEPVEETVEEVITEEIIEEPKAEPVETSTIVEEKPKEAEQTNKVDFDMPVFNPNNTVDNVPSGVLSEDDIFKDEDLDEGKDLFSVLFGDD